jgi:hypothetical protein
MMGDEMNKPTTLVLQIVVALSLIGSLVVQAFIVPTIWVDLEGVDLATRITFVTLIMLGIVTMQVFAVCVWQLLTKVRAGSVFSESSFRYVDVIIGSIAAASVVVFVIAVLLVPGGAAPGVVGLICGAALVLGGMALLVVVMKSLLRQAIDRETEASALRSELDEVV